MGESAEKSIDIAEHNCDCFEVDSCCLAMNSNFHNQTTDVIQNVWKLVAFYRNWLIVYSKFQ